MSKEALGVGLKVLISLLICFAVHYAIISFTDFGNSIVNLGYSLLGFYGFELIFTLGVFFAMFGMKSSMPNNLGFVFLGVITLRLIASYLFAREGLDSEAVDQTFKYNFLVIVLIFLASDAYIAYHILNKNVTTEKS